MLTHSNRSCCMDGFPNRNENFLTIAWNESVGAQGKGLLRDWVVDCTEMHWSIKYEIFCISNIYCGLEIRIFPKIHTATRAWKSSLLPSILKTFVVSISFAFNCADDLIQQKQNWHFCEHGIQLQTYDLFMQSTRRCLLAFMSCLQAIVHSIFYFIASS